MCFVLVQVLLFRIEKFWAETNEAHDEDQNKIQG